MTIFMPWSNLFPSASAWVKAYTAYIKWSCISKLVLIQHILCTQVSDTGNGPLVSELADAHAYLRNV